MKRIVTAIVMAILTGTLPAHAQQGISPEMQQQMQKMQNMSPAEREAFIKNMQKEAYAMQNCMNNAMTEKDIEEFKARTDSAMAHVKALCQAGQRDDAQAYAMKTGEQFAKDPKVRGLQACSQHAMADMPFMNMAEPQTDGKMHHVCDEQK